MSKPIYKHSEIESKWQETWTEKMLYSPNLSTSKKPFYNLMMFPYPSAEGLHVGNMYAFTGADVYGRFKRMTGLDVFEPIGLDGFGIHSENYAIKVGRHPKEHAKVSQENFYRQLQDIGNGFAWDHRLETYDPVYYRWTQWLFIKMWEAGLAYKGEAVVNWCPSDKTVLADEQVIDGKCERCSSVVERRKMSSWYFRITDYADKLLEGLKKIDWPEKIKIAQRNWVGRSEGRLIEFKTDSKKTIKVFTTRPDTLNAVTFIATSKLYQEGSKVKIGKFTGKFAISPLDGREIPIWDTNYVAPNYATGVVMGVPAHDERDRDFAVKYHIDILGLEPKNNDYGKKYTTYHLRDWLISRQRYWGPPIPMLYCDKCGYKPVPLDQLPVVLPDIDDFKPKGDGTSPLANAPIEWQKTKCPSCGGQAQRELDVSDTFLDSSWYFLRYPSIHSNTAGQLPFDPEITKKWLPVDTYIGGAEHAVLHLLYARFIWKVLIDQGHLPVSLGMEPFPYFYSHGLIIKDGAKMSKSKGNVVVPDDYIKKFGADTLRCYLMFLGPYNQGGDFRDTGIEGMHRFLMRVWELFDVHPPSPRLRKSNSDEVTIKMHRTIKKVTNDIENFRYNTAISAIMEFVNVMREKGASEQNLQILAQLIAPFAPHMAEEVWEGLGQEFSIHKSSWPKWDEKLTVEQSITIAIQVNGKFRGTLILGLDEIKNQGKVEEKAREIENVSKWIKDKQIKVVYVEGKVINFVI